MFTNQNKTAPGFPFGVDVRGRIAAQGGDAAVRAKIVQILFTSPGERVHVPDFGCGLYRLVFEPLDETLRTYTEFIIRQSLLRWMGDEINVESVNVETTNDELIIELVYVNQHTLRQDAVRIRAG